METLQKQLSNGNWVDCDADAVTTNFIEKNRAVLLTGKSISVGSDWYQNRRLKPAPRVTVAPELVKCACGHSVPRNQVMSASMGSSCLDCYDRMS